jgi:hypothetical protein
LPAFLIPTGKGVETTSTPNTPCRRCRAWLVVGPALFCLADAGLTLWGQPQGYFAGGYGSGTEGNPVFRPLLTWHPAVFLVGVGLWVGTVFLAVVALPERFARGASVLVLFAHAFGAGSWLVIEGVAGWIGAVALLVIGRFVLGWSEGHYLNCRGDSERPAASG